MKKNCASPSESVEATGQNHSTPIPLQLRIVRHGSANEPAVIIGENIQIIVDHSQNFGDPGPVAKLICKAVNSHEGLVAMLTELVDVESRHSTREGTDRARLHAHSQARQVLADLASPLSSP